MANGQSSNLDFLRSFAVLLVLGQHLTRRIFGDTTSLPTAYLGLFGVLLFFVHTSLVLMSSMERSGLQGRTLLRDFYIRRFFRIYPLSILTVAVALSLHLGSDINHIPGLSYGPLPSFKAVVVQFFLLQNVAHVKSIVNVLWSLPYEVQMYLFLPFLFAWVRRRSKTTLWALFALWLLSFAGAWIQPSLRILDRAPLLLFVPCFLPGIIAYALPHKPRFRSFLWPMFVVALVFAYTIRPGHALGRWLCLVLGLAIPFFHEIQSPWLRLISNRIAKYSYGIYLSHQFCIWFALGVLAGYSLWLRTSILIASLLLVPIALYHGLEKPMIGLGVRIAARRKQKAVEALPAVAA